MCAWVRVFVRGVCVSPLAASVTVKATPMQLLTTKLFQMFAEVWMISYRSVAFGNNSYQGVAVAFTAVDTL